MGAIENRTAEVGMLKVRSAKLRLGKITTFGDEAFEARILGPVQISKRVSAAWFILWNPRRAVSFSDVDGVASRAVHSCKLHELCWRHSRVLPLIEILAEIGAGVFSLRVAGDIGHLCGAPYDHKCYEKTRSFEG